MVFFLYCFSSFGLFFGSFMILLVVEGLFKRNSRNGDTCCTF